MNAQACFDFHQLKTWTPKSDVRLLDAQDRVASLEGVRITDAAVFTALLWFVGPSGCFPSHASLSERAHVSTATVKRSLSKLRGLGLISWTRSSGTAGNRYSFHRRELFRRQPQRAATSSREREAPPPRRLAPELVPPAPIQIAHSEPSKSLKVSDEDRVGDTEAPLAGGDTAPAAADKAESAPIRAEIKATIGYMGASDPLPERLLGVAKAGSGTASDVVAWIASKAGRRIRSAGFFWAIRTELKEFVADRNELGAQEATGACEDCGKTVAAYLELCGDCSWTREARREAAKVDSAC